MATEIIPAHSATVYNSPQIDMGYNISDYKDIDPNYGTLLDVDELIKKLGDRDMKLMMDLVVNHTSNQVTRQAADDTNSDYSSAFLVPQVTIFYWEFQTGLVHLEEG